jgi:hypothetical protein
VIADEIDLFHFLEIGTNVDGVAKYLGFDDVR